MKFLWLLLIMIALAGCASVQGGSMSMEKQYTDTSSWYIELGPTTQPSDRGGK